MYQYHDIIAIMSDYHVVSYLLRVSLQLEELHMLGSCVTINEETTHAKIDVLSLIRSSIGTKHLHFDNHTCPTISTGVVSSLIPIISAVHRSTNDQLPTPPPPPLVPCQAR